MLKTEAGLTKQRIVAELTKSTHGKLEEYEEVGKQAILEDPEFAAKLMAWNWDKGQIRDSKVALPILGLGVAQNPEYRENALAHLALLSPRDLVRALDFAYGRVKGNGRAVKKLVERYLREREKNWAWWERTALQHKASLKTLYARYHVKPAALADEIVMKGKAPEGTVFAEVRRLVAMPAAEAAGTILEKRIPFLVAAGALGKRMKEPDLLLAIIERMSPAELVTNVKMLEKLGVREQAATRGAFEAALARAAESGKGSTFKTTRAAEVIGDGVLASKLRGLQEKQIEKLGGVEGDWLVLADKSGSMEAAIEAARQVAGVLSRVAKGAVHLIFFDVSPRHFAVTGKSFEEIKGLTSAVQANGGTSIGCGLKYALEKGLSFQGIAIVSDAEENTAPLFADVYKKMAEVTGEEPAVYLYKVGISAEQAQSMRLAYGARYQQKDSLTPAMQEKGLEMQTFDLGSKIDYYSLANVAATMRVSRYALVDEILSTPLRTVDGVFAKRVVEGA